MWLTEVGMTVKCKWVIVASNIVLCNYIVVISPWMSSTACKIYRTQKCGLYMPFSGWALQLQVTFVLCECRPCIWELFVSKRNRIMPKETIRSRNCLPSENTKTFWKKVSLLVVVLLQRALCLTTSQHLKFLTSCRNTVWLFQILPCIASSVEFVQQVW